MLTVLDAAGGTDCDGLSRRDFIRLGALGVGGLTLPGLLQTQARADTAIVRDKAVVLLFLSGGPSHIETFNPNMTAPSPFCSVTGEVQTSVPGLTFGGTFPQLARHAHRMSVVRSFQHPVGGHVEAIVHVLNGGTNPTGKGDTGFSIGSACARLGGANDSETGMPSYVLLNSQEVDGQYRNERGRVERGSAPGPLGAAWRPFNPSGGGTAVENMTLNTPVDRLQDRKTLLQALDRLKRTADASGQLEGADKFTRQAFDVVMGSAAAAFDLSQESPSMRERYDTTRFQVGKKKFRPSQLGRHFLTARRAIEAGARFVTIHSAGWDMHADSNNPGIYSGMEMLGRPVDKAVGAFLTDLEQRGLSNKVLLVITGDFGRTPKINSRGGRDHWPRLCTLALAGGGLNHGGALGRSARKNDVPNSTPVSAANLFGTVIHTVFDVPALRLVSGIPGELARQIANNAPIAGLV